MTIYNDHELRVTIMQNGPELLKTYDNVTDLWISEGFVDFRQSIGDERGWMNFHIPIDCVVSVNVAVSQRVQYETIKLPITRSGRVKGLKTLKKGCEEKENQNEQYD